jgi:hypothetical protein
LVGQWADITEIEAPAVTYPTSRRPEFPYIRGCQPFEAVMAYHHITMNQDYIQNRGFTNVNNRSHQIDPHGLNGADNSHYVGNPPGMGHISFGEGGVDDAEDAEVIIHEYGHSIQDNQSPGTYFGNGNRGFGNETSAMGEGFGDYWACSYFEYRSTSTGSDPAAFAEWDAQDVNGLRRVDGNKVYPTDMANEEHDDGEIWSRALWDLHAAIGQHETDKLTLQSHFMVPANPRFTDGARAILAADVIENAGANKLPIVTTFAARGIFRKTTVSANVEGKPVSVTPPDVTGLQGGIGPLDFYHDYAESVIVSVQGQFAAASASEPQFLHWTIDGVDQPEGLMTVWLVADETPAEHTAVAVYETSTGVHPGVPTALALRQNVPNPFNPATTIEYDLPADCDLQLVIFDISGRAVRTLRSGREAAGYRSAQWDGRNDAGERVGSGVYFYRLRAGNDVLTKKMTLLK